MFQVLKILVYYLRHLSMNQVHVVMSIDIKRLSDSRRAGWHYCSCTPPRLAIHAKHYLVCWFYFRNVLCAVLTIELLYRHVFPFVDVIVLLYGYCEVETAFICVSLV
jgi:hypothetical protein